jgi:hypothetical protein
MYLEYKICARKEIEDGHILCPRIGGRDLKTCFITAGLKFSYSAGGGDTSEGRALDRPFKEIAKPKNAFIPAPRCQIYR